MRARQRQNKRVLQRFSTHVRCLRDKDQSILHHHYMSPNVKKFLTLAVIVLVVLKFRDTLLGITDKIPVVGGLVR